MMFATKEQNRITFFYTKNMDDGCSWMFSISSPPKKYKEHVFSPPPAPNPQKENIAWLWETQKSWEFKGAFSNASLPRRK